MATNSLPPAVAAWMQQFRRHGLSEDVSEALASFRAFTEHLTAAPPPQTGSTDVALKYLAAYAKWLHEIARRDLKQLKTREADAWLRRLLDGLGKEGR